MSRERTIKNTGKALILMVAMCAALFVLAGCPNPGPSSSSASTNARESTADEIVVKEVDYSGDFLHDGEAGFYMYETEDGVAVYDLDIDKNPVSDGQSLSFVEDGDEGLRYILENGYPGKTYRNNKGMDAYITQMAIWWYVSEDKVSSDFKNATDDQDEYGLTEATKKLVEGAKEAASSAGDEGDGSEQAKIYATGDSGDARMVGLF